MPRQNRTAARVNLDLRLDRADARTLEALEAAPDVLPLEDAVAVGFGRVDVDDVLDRIFSQFCIGK